MGLLRSLWQLTTVIVAGPAGFVGVLALLKGDYAVGALFLAMAVAFAVLSELAYVRLTRGSFGRLRSLVPGLGGDESDE